jgi:hypothetical protein
MRQVTTFEGWYDEDGGWEFDMPVYMVKPILGYTEAGSGVGGVEELVEEYLISRSEGEDEDGNVTEGDLPFGCGVDDDEIHFIKCQFAYAKKGKARAGVQYWRQVVEWDGELKDVKELESVTYNRDSPDNPLTGRDAT